MSTPQESPNQASPETHNAKPFNDPNAIEPPPPKPDVDSETFNDPKATEPPQPKPDDNSKTINDPKAIEPPQPKPDDDSKTFNDPKAIEPSQPKPDDDPKNLKDPNDTEPPQPKPDDISKTFNDPKAIESPQPKPDNDSKTFNDPKAIEPQLPKPDDDPKNLKDPNATETPPETDDPKTLKDPNANETLPSKTETSSENQPIVEVTETLKQATATDVDSQAPPLDEKPNEIIPADDDEPTSKQKSLPKKDFSETNSNADPSPKKPSFWKIVSKNLLKNFPYKKNSHDKPYIAESTPDKKKLDRMPSTLKEAIEGDCELADKGSKVLSEYKKHLNELLEAYKKLEARQGEVSKKLEAQQDEGRSSDEIRELQHELLKLQEDLIKLRLRITLKYKVDEKGSFKNFHFSSKSKQTVPQEVLAMMPQLHKKPFFETCPEFKDFEARYENLEPKLKLCLLCFSIFPEKAVIRKRVMVQWWVSEGFASEEDANDYFIQLVKKGFIEPVNENRSLLVIGSCKMHPFYRSALVMLAERATFLNFDPKGRTTQNFSGSFRASLVGEGLISYEDYKGDPLNAVLDLEKVHLLTNIKEEVLEFKKDWFAKMKSLNYLYLGKWEVEATGHREVDDTVFLDELENMSYLKFLCLQGVSNMINLPESVLKLKNLEILDIRACHNLETIPDKIGSLKWLTHLDMSDCFLIERMPKDISLLKELRVLKGFVVGEDTGKTCTLGDLKKLTNLVKLCIYTGLREFPDDKNVEDLGNLTGLKKLTITWGGNAFRTGDEAGVGGSLKTDGLFPVLEKLDLRYFPRSKTPDWLAVRNVKGLSSRLKKLYVRAGKFSDIGQYQDSDSWEWPVEKDTWKKVEVLRLRYLPEIEMEWRQVQELFPSLVFLEQVGCPRLTLFPCDANGVWMKP